MAKLTLDGIEASVNSFLEIMDCPPARVEDVEEEEYQQYGVPYKVVLTFFGREDKEEKTYDTTVGIADPDEYSGTNVSIGRHVARLLIENKREALEAYLERVKDE